jgi:tape measure domain-containing protein
MSSTVLTVTAEVNGDAKGLIAAFKSAGATVKTFSDDTKKAASGSGSQASIWSRAWTGATKLVSGAAIGVVGAATAMGAAFTFKTLSAGLSRLTAIQDATSATGVIMGSAAKAGELMANVLNVVRGTPFNFDQFATAAKNLAAFGVDAAKIPGILTAVGNAAAASGRGADAVDQITTALGQAATAGKITGDTINTLSQAGVPALQILANANGVTTDEMQKMVSKGAVPALKAIDDLTAGIMNGSNGAAGSTVALGGAMEALRNTFSGALGGMKAAMARLGAAVIAPWMGDLTKLVTDAGGLFDALGVVLGRLSDQAEKSHNPIQKISDVIVKLTDALKSIGSAKDMGAALQEIFDKAAATSPGIALLVGLFDALKPLVPAISDFLKDFGKALVPLAPGFADVVKEIIPLLPHLSELVVKMLPQLVKLLPPLVELLGKVADAVSAWLPSLGPVIDAVANFVGWLGTDSKKALNDFADGLDSITPLAKPVTDAIRGLGDYLSNGFTTNMSDAGTGISDFFTNTNGMVNDFVSNTEGMFGDFFSNTFGMFSDFFTNTGGMISDFVTNVGTAWSDFWTTFGEVATSVWDTIGKTIGNFIKLILGFFTGDFGAIPGIVSGILAQVGGFFTDAFNNIVAGVTGFFAWIGATWSAGWNALPAVLSAAWAVIQSTVSGAVSSFIGFFTGLPGTIAGIWNNVVSAVSTGIGNVVNWVQSLPGKVQSAVSGAGSWLINTGRDMINGMISGIEKAASGVANAAIKAAKDAIGAVGKWLGINSPSRRVRDELGKPMGEGMAVGITAMKPTVTQSLTDLIALPKKYETYRDTVAGVKNAVATANPANQPLPPVAGGGTQTTSNKTINLTIQVDATGLSDKDVDELTEKIVDKVRFAVGGGDEG